jgi:cytochrome c oxidase subunit II
MNSDFRLFPEQASTMAGEVDALYFYLLAVSGFFTVLICILILYFAIHYRRGAKVDRARLPESKWLEITWTVIPLVLALSFFAWGATLYVRMKQPPPGANEIDEIYVVGKQWMWKIQHPNGRREINTLHLPLGRPVKLKMISEDVIHSFFIPNFRVKMDVLPGRFTDMWFTPNKVGSFHLFCAEYCGTSHSQMIGKVIVMEPADYSAWLAGSDPSQPRLSGKALFEQYRCHTCHRAGGGVSRGPPLDGIFGKMIPLADGSTVVADEAYIRESILEPGAKVRAGYEPVMPTFEGQIGEEDILAIINHLKSTTD